MRMKLRAVLFDLDNTLIDTTESFFRFLPFVAGAFIRDVTRHALDDLYAFLYEYEKLSESERALRFISLKKAHPFICDVTAEDVWNHVTDNFPSFLSLTEGAIETMTFFKQKNILMGIVTNGSMHFQRKKIESLGIYSFMKTILISEEVGICKPDKRIFRIALARLKCMPEETLFIGDHPLNDVDGAMRSGLSAIWLKKENFWDLTMKPPCMILESLTDIPKALETFWGS